VTSQLLAVAFEALDPARLGRFWAELMSREIHDDARGVLLPGEDAQLSVRFVPGLGHGTGPNRMHLHLTSTSASDQRRTVERATGLGAGHLDVGQRPEEGHVVLGDPEGNEFCVIEPGNSFLDDCGFLGELACEGTRTVGRFWSGALGWPLVWDQDQETAVQSPRGGTKVAWGGPPVAPKSERNRQWFEIAPTHGHQGQEIVRLVSIGATRLGRCEDGAVMMADPDGNEFRMLLPGRP
jgi:hypothetical protein